MTYSDLMRERIPSDAARFEQAKLNHIETEEKQVLPSKQGNGDLMCVRNPDYLSEVIKLHSLRFYNRQHSTNSKDVSYTSTRHKRLLERSRSPKPASTQSFVTNLML